MLTVMRKHKEYRVAFRLARKPRGQGLVEGSCAMILITLLFVLLLAMGVNVYSVITYDSELRLVATQAAEAYDNHMYWLGMGRADYNADMATQDATNLAISLASTYGITLTKDDVKFSTTNINIPLNSTSTGGPSAPIQATGITCEITLNQLKIPFSGGVFPALIKRDVQSTVANMSLPAPCYVDINSHTLNGTNATVSVPAYFAYKPDQVSFNSNGDPFNFNSGTAQSGGSPIGNIQANTYYGIRLDSNCMITDPRNTLGKYKVQ